MIKKRQHYVYQKYLEPWTNKGQVWCLFNRTNANPVNTINIGQEKYFYQIKDFTAQDLSVAKQLVSHNKDSFYSSYWVDFYDGLLKLQDYTKEPDNDKELVEVIKRMCKQIEEEVNSGIENRLLPFLQKMLNKDLSFLKVDENKFMLCYCLMEQLSRTKMMKDIVMHGIQHIENCNFENVWSLVRHSYCGFIGFVLAVQEMNYCLLNNPNNNFITCDQPVISTKFDLVDDVFDMEYYYPISPNLALFITKDKNYPNLSIKEVSCEEVEKFNLAMVCNSNFQLYGKTKEDIEKYKEQKDCDNLCT